MVASPPVILKRSKNFAMTHVLSGGVGARGDKVVLDNGVRMRAGDLIEDGIAPGAGRAAAAAGVEKAAAAVLLRISGVSCNKNGVMNV